MLKIIIIFQFEGDAFIRGRGQQPEYGVSPALCEHQKELCCRKSFHETVNQKNNHNTNTDIMHAYTALQRNVFISKIFSL